MKPSIVARLLFLLATVLHTQITVAYQLKEDTRDILCAACLAIVDEMNYEISKVDPKKMTTVGSFRLDPNGNMKVKEVPFATSEENLVDVMDNICDRKLQGYVEKFEKEEKDLNKTLWVRDSDRDGKKIKMSDMRIDNNRRADFRRACFNILEEHEDLITRIFNSGEKDLEESLCHNKLSLCSQLDLRLKREFLETVPKRVEQYAADERERREKADAEKKAAEEEQRKKAEEENKEKDDEEDEEENNIDDDDEGVEMMEDVEQGKDEL